MRASSDPPSARTRRKARAFAKRRGYRETRREQYWALDVDLGAAPPSPPTTSQVVRLAEVLDRERDLFELYEVGGAGHARRLHVHTMEFEDWNRDTLENPELDAGAERRRPRR